MAVELKDVETLVRVQLGLKSISPDDRLMEDLGAVSADIVNVIATAEERFRVSIAEADISKVRCVRDLHGLIDAAEHGNG